MELKKLNKKAITLSNVFISMSVVSLLVIVFLLIPAEEYGFWSNYGFSLQSNQLNDLDQSGNVSQAIIDMNCELNPGTDGCEDVPKRSVLDTLNQVNPFINNILGNGYSALITIQKFLGFTGKFVANWATLLGMPPKIAVILEGLINIGVILAIVGLFIGVSQKL